MTMVRQPCRGARTQVNGFTLDVPTRPEVLLSACARWNPS